jgi:signal transduction histidine kinase/ligand-binding sensor domain-containing protein/DNA-binding response OmpR family regulator
VASHGCLRPSSGHNGKNRFPDHAVLLLFLLLAVALLVVAPSCHAASPLRFFHLGSADGLPQATIRAILKTKAGYLWAGTEDGLVRLAGTSLKLYKKSLKNSASLSDNYVASLAESPDGAVWVGLKGGGLNRIAADGQSVSRLPDLNLGDEDILALAPDGAGLWLGTANGLQFLDTASQQVRTIPLLREDSPSRTAVKSLALGEQCLWMAVPGIGLARYFPRTGRTQWFEPGQRGLTDKTITTVFRDALGRIWAGSENSGLVEILQQGHDIAFRRHTVASDGLGANEVTSVADAGSGRLWIGSWDGGLQLFDPQHGVVASYRHSPANPDSLCSNIVTTIVADGDQNVWVGSFDKGLDRFSPRQAFKAFVHDPLVSPGLPDNVVWCFAQTSADTLWIGTAKGLARLSLTHFAFAPLDGFGDVAARLGGDDVRAMAVEGNTLWLGTRRKGLWRLDLRTGTTRSVQDVAGRDVPLASTDIRLLLSDPEHSALWIGAGAGLDRYDTATGEVAHFRHRADDPASLPHNRIRALYKDAHGALWVGTSLGLARLRPDQTGFDVWKQDPAAPDTSLAGEGVRAIVEDGTGRYWLGTENGISLFSPETGVLRNLREEDGLPSHSIYALVPSKGRLWASSMRGVAGMDPGSLDIRRYFKQDGLADNECNFNAWLRLASGEIVFGGVQGFTLFDPGLAPGPETPRPQPSLAVTVQPGAGATYAAQDHRWQLDWRAPGIAFAYAALAFEPPGNILYRTRLKGAGTDWQETRDVTVGYPGLRPGNYVFEVEAADVHGQWRTRPQSVAFAVLPPPWLTGPAFAAYAAVVLALMAALVRLAASRQRQRAVWLEQQVAVRSTELARSNAALAERNRRLDELVVSRERLFQSVAHELRTPLSVIVAALDQDKDSFAEKGRRSVQLALNSAHRLGNLIKAILDVSRQDARRNDTLFAVSRAMDDLLDPFRLLAQTSGQRFVVAVSGLDDDWLAMDRELFLAAVGNLISNGLKYAGAGGEVRFAATSRDGRLQIEVADNGPGIAAEELPGIFDWFSRGAGSLTREGWGLGLPTAKHIVAKYHGTIEARPAPAGGMLFALSLPLAAKPEQPAAFPGMPQACPVNDDREVLTGKRIVVVEDDPDLCEQLVGIFQSSCEVFSAPDAVQGMRLVATHLPDLIVSDVMLPGKSGLDLTREIKDNLDTCHIPVLLISAFDEEVLREQGYLAAADACLGKPFEPRELVLRACALLKNRELAAARIKRAVLYDTPPETPAGDRAETGDTEVGAFLDRFRQELPPMSQFADMQLSDMARRMGMSPRNLQRAFEKAGMTWREFKRLHQLRCAMNMLRETDWTMTRIAEDSGFGASAYFSKVFKEHVGVTPTAWRASNAAPGAETGSLPGEHGNL